MTYNWSHGQSHTPQRTHPCVPGMGLSAAPFPLAAEVPSPLHRWTPPRVWVFGLVAAGASRAYLSHSELWIAGRRLKKRHELFHCQGSSSCLCAWRQQLHMHVAYHGDATLTVALNSLHLREVLVDV